jgi:ABC-2 type transport system permease protein
MAGLVFTAGGAAVAVAEDADAGLYDRLRSLPVASSAVLAGRVVSDAALLLGVALVTAVVGVVAGFRGRRLGRRCSGGAGLAGRLRRRLAALFVWVGLVSGSAQAAQGLGIVGVPFSFLSSALVPVDSMPGVLQVFADNQPLTFMVDASRGLLLGDAVAGSLQHGVTYAVTGSLLWSLAIVLVSVPLALRAYRRDG